MDLGGNIGYTGYGSPSGSVDSENSISRYLGNQSMADGDSFGMQGFGSFSDIFSDYLQTQSIDSELISILDHLDEKRELPSHSLKEASQKIFDAIEMLLSGFSDIVGSFNKAAPQDHLSDLDRLISGAKQVFDLSEDPATLEQMGQTWQKLKKRDSPLFHSVHAYFLHISISFSNCSRDTSNASKASKASYQDTTLTAMISMVNNFEDSTEKNEILLLLDNEDISEEVPNVSENVIPLESANFNIQET